MRGGEAGSPLWGMGRVGAPSVENEGWETPLWGVGDTCVGWDPTLQGMGVGGRPPCGR